MAVHQVRLPVNVIVSNAGRRSHRSTAVTGYIPSKSRSRCKHRPVDFPPSITWVPWIARIIEAVRRVVEYGAVDTRRAPLFTKVLDCA